MDRKLPVREIDLMEKGKFLCPECKQSKNRDVAMLENYDLLTCPECRTSFAIEGKSPLGRYAENWRGNAERVFPLLRPPLYQSDLANLRLFYLYEDCYHALLIGRNNASIVLMGVLLEALMKERIWLKLGVYLRGAYGDCLKKIEDDRLMDAKDIRFLSEFKEKIRNPYQHADEVRILEDAVGGFVEVYPVAIDMSKSVTSQLRRAITDMRSGILKPKQISPTAPLVRSLAKQKLDEERVVGLFNKIYDFLLTAKVKYFRQEDYDEHNKKFGTTM